MDLATVIQGFTILQQTRLMRISAITIALYDHVITIADEIQLIWKKRWSLGKILFLIIRYQNIAIVSFELAVLFNNHPSQKLCHAWLQWQFYAAMSVCIWTEVVMLVRIYAMYGASKKILYVLLPLFAANVFTAGTLIGKVLLNHGLSTPLTPDVSLCTIKGNPQFTFWLPIICFETILFGLALYKGIHHFKFHATFRQGLGTLGRGLGWKGQRAIDVLIRDSVLYYAIIFVVYFLQALFFIFDKPLVEAPAGWAYFIPTVLSARLLFNIRRVFDATTYTSIDTGTTFSLAYRRSQLRSQGFLTRNTLATNNDTRVGGGTTIVEEELGSWTGQRANSNSISANDGSDTSLSEIYVEDPAVQQEDYDDVEEEPSRNRVGGGATHWIGLGWLAAEAAEVESGVNGLRRRH